MMRIFSYKFRRTTLQLGFFLAILCGLELAKTSLKTSTTELLIAGFISVVLWRCRNLMTIVAVVALGVGLGLWRGTTYSNLLKVYQPLQYQKVSLVVHANENGIYNQTKQMSFGAGGVSLDGQALPGRLLVSGFGMNSVFQGDEILVSGKLYPGYGIYQGRISYAKLELVKHHPSVVADVRRRFTAGMQTALPEPLAPFAMGLLVGQRATLPDNVKQDLLMVGLTHIIAVSGYNLTIILQASRRLLEGQSKRLSTGLSLSLIATFLLIAGSSASIVRAAIVSVLSIIAGYYGRRFRSLNLLALAAVITAWGNPVYVWSDLSWYLSFLAFFGVMVLSPLIQKRWPARWHKSIIGGVALESVCAEIMSLPFILYIFGQMSLIGLPANVLVVALVPLAMLLSFVAGLAGMLAPSIAGWLAWPAKLLLNYMLEISHFMAHLPGVFLQNRELSLSSMLLLYGLVAGLCLILSHKTKPPKPVTITDMIEPQTKVIAT